MGALKVDEKNFEAEVLKSNIPVLVDFWAEWCPPCKAISPMIDQLAEEMKGALKVVKVNVDEAQELAASHNIMSIPTLLIYKKGQPVDFIIGALGKDQLLAKIKPQLA